MFSERLHREAVNAGFAAEGGDMRILMWTGLLALLPTAVSAQQTTTFQRLPTPAESEARGAVALVAALPEHERREAFISRLSRVVGETLAEEQVNDPSLAGVNARYEAEQLFNGLCTARALPFDPSLCDLTDADLIAVYQATVERRNIARHCNRYPDACGGVSSAKSNFSSAYMALIAPYYGRYGLYPYYGGYRPYPYYRGFGFAFGGYWHGGYRPPRPVPYR